MADADKTAEPKTAEPKTGFVQDDATKQDAKLKENSQKNLGDKLDEALEETFPSSDPVSVKITK